MHVDEAVITCCHKDCGISFAVPSWWCRGKKQTRSTFFCPNGHSQHFSGETEEEKLRRERNLLAQRIAQKDDEIASQRRMREEAERSASAFRGQVTRLRNRAKAGLCPCCNRHFTNLERHIKGQHPEFQGEEKLRAAE